MTFLDRGRTVATVKTAPPPGSSPRESATPGIVRQVSGEFSDVMQGRLTLLALNTMILALVLFYLWTRRAQGGG